MDRKSLIEAFIAEARTYVGVKWLHRGRSRYGIDCVGLLVNSVASVGQPMRDRLDYGREPWNDGLDREMREHFGAAVLEMQPGDVVTMKGIGQQGAGHVGIIAQCNGYLTLIHSYNADSNTRVVEHRIDEQWQARFVEIYRPFP